MKTILLSATFALSATAALAAPDNLPNTFTDKDFRKAAVAFFMKERLKKNSYFYDFKEDFLNDPERIQFGKYWENNRLAFNFFIIDKTKMKYEYDYPIIRTAMKIHGDIKVVDQELQFGPYKLQAFRHGFR